MNKKRILFFIPNSMVLHNEIANSIVLKQILQLQKLGYACLLISSDIDRNSARLAEKKLLCDFGVRARISGKYRTRICLISKVIKSRKIFRDFRTDIDEFCPTCIYTRQILETITAKRIAKIYNASLIYHVEGCVSEEVKLKTGKKGILYYAFKIFEKKAIKNANRLICVSHQLGRWVEGEFGRRDYVVIPCCVGIIKKTFSLVDRAKARKLMGFSEEHKVICYCGGVQTWQRIEDIVHIAKEVLNRRGDFRFLFLTREIDKLNSIISEAQIDRQKIYIRSCKPEQVPFWLGASDVGIILRLNNIVNNVASPIKIGEYLACGLPVLLTRHIGDISGLVSDNNVGFTFEQDLVNIDNVIHYVESLDSRDIHSKCIEFAKIYYDWAAYAEEFETLYR